MQQTLIIKRTFSRVPRQLSELLVPNSPVVNTTHLKQRLYKAGLKIERCDWCGVGPWWRGNRLTLEMDHINGCRRDNRLENLRILCLNCHSQTSTFRRRRQTGRWVAQDHS